LFLVPKPETLQLESTNDCFMNCWICMRANSRRSVGYLSMENYRKLPLSKFREVAFHGWGEPLLHPKICEMISYAKSLGLKASLITNGYLLSKKAEELIDSGLDELAVGIYTLRGRDAVLRGVKEFLELRRSLSKPKVLFDITILKENLSEIPEIIEVGSELGIDAVVLHRLFNAHNPKLLRPTKDEERKLLKEVDRISKSLGIKVFKPPTKQLRPCIVVLKCMFITWDCKYSPCCFLAELGHTLGNALRDDVFRIHRDFVIRGFRRYGVCKSCPW